jgi:isoquinoline 1-oxidoreductase beta subunit
MGKWTRRAFIGAGTLVGGGLVLGVGGIAFAPNRLRRLPDPDDAGTGERLTTWIKITPENEVVAIIPHCEMGQGAVTGIAMMLAEELEADWSRVRIEEAPAEDVFANGYVFRAFAEEFGIEAPRWMERALDFGAYKMAGIADLQTTGGSSSTRGTGRFGMRVAGAAAKAMLLEAAARRFDVTTEELTARDSRITHAASGRSATYGELAAEAAALEVPTHPPLKDRSEYRLVGTPRRRPDIPDKVTGTATYGIDVVVPDMWVAAIMAAPTRGGLLQAVDPAPAKAVAGVHDVVLLDDAVAVVADGYWQATQGLRALTPEFSQGEIGAVDSERIYSDHGAALDGEEWDDVAPGATRTVSAEYRVPYLAHATMEPMCATARFEGGRLEVWAGTQDPLNARRAAASAAGIDQDAVVMHNLHLGGGFGRRLPGTFDYVAQAVRIAQAVSPRAVKLIWSREEDMQHGYYRPTVLSRLRGELDAAGRPLTWAHLFTGSRFLDVPAATPPYAIGEVDLRAVSPPSHLRTGSWRSVASSQHGFFMESFVDELAAAAGEDPFEYRRSLLAEEPRHRAVLERAAEMAGWGSPPAAGRARGIAIVESFGTVVAEVAEVGLDDEGGIRVYRVDAAVDCGLVVNPEQAAAQIEGGVIFGLSAALFQEITVRGGAVEQRSFPDYEMIRLADAPTVNVAFLESDAVMGGLGEPGVPPIAPAVANAVFALTGRRLRTLPLRL